MPVKLLTSGGGGVNLVPSSSIASDQTIYLPTSGTSGGTVLCTDSTGGTANGVLYLNGSKQVTSGSGLVFDGINLGLGGTPSAWGAGQKAIQAGNFTAIGAGNGFTSNGYYNAGWKYVANGYATNIYEQNGSLKFDIALSGTAGNAITFTEQMRLSSTGLRVTGQHFVSSSLTGNEAVNISNTSDNPFGVYVSFSATSPNNTSNYGYRLQDSTTYCYTIWSNGTTSGRSDERFKKNIEDAPNYLDKLNMVRVRNYEWKESIGGIKELGVIAQELETVFPSLVITETDKDKDGNDLGTTTKSVKYSVFVPMLIKAVQELSAQNKELTQRIEALEYTKQGE